MTTIKGAEMSARFSTRMTTIKGAARQLDIQAWIQHAGGIGNSSTPQVEVTRALKAMSLGSSEWVIGFSIERATVLVYLRLRIIFEEREIADSTTVQDQECTAQGRCYVLWI